MNEEIYAWHINHWISSFLTMFHVASQTKKGYIWREQWNSQSYGFQKCLNQLLTPRRWQSHCFTSCKQVLILGRKSRIKSEVQSCFGGIVECGEWGLVFKMAKSPWNNVKLVNVHTVIDQKDCNTRQVSPYTEV